LPTFIENFTPYFGNLVCRDDITNQHGMYTKNNTEQQLPRHDSSGAALHKIIIFTLLSKDCYFSRTFRQLVQHYYYWELFRRMTLKVVLQ